LLITSSRELNEQHCKKAKSVSDIFSQNNLLVFALYSVVTWIIGHQSSHIASLKNGQATLNWALAFVMGLETFLGLLFLVWFGYRTLWYQAVLLLLVSLAVRPLLIIVERGLGLTQRAWLISTFGIILVPVLLVTLIFVVESGFPN
jgi:hypothetical protein